MRCTVAETVDLEDLNQEDLSIQGWKYGPLILALRPCSGGSRVYIGYIVGI